MCAIVWGRETQTESNSKIDELFYLGHKRTKKRRYTVRASLSTFSNTTS
jgi:hypothetical protein